jgi:hypothetical protein
MSDHITVEAPNAWYGATHSSSREPWLAAIGTDDLFGHGAQDDAGPLRPESMAAAWTRITLAAFLDF